MVIFEIQTQVMKISSNFILAFSVLSFSVISAHNESGSDSVKKEEKRPPYQPSATRVNDLIHTRLDVQFDWNKAQMQGKAAITGKPYFKPTSRLDLNAKGMDIQSVEVFDLGKTKTANL